MDDFQQVEMTKEEEREYREYRFNEKILSHRVSEEELKEILEEKKKQEIKRMVGIAEQIDLTGIYLLIRDATTLLAHQREVEARGENLEKKVG